jgi:hypothetical protein
MNKLIIGAFALILLFGCIGQPSSGPKVEEGNVTIPIVGDVIEETNKTISGCTPEYTVTAPESAELSATVLVTIEAECAKNKTVEVLFNGASVSAATIPADSSVLNFNIVASKDKTNKLEIRSDGHSIHSSNLKVSSIGFTDTSGTDNDPISIRRWKAVAFELDNKIEVKSIGAYLKRLTPLDLGSDIVLEIRSDSAGEPGSIVATSTKPLSSVTLSPNWLYFPFNATLDKGRYFVVFRLTEDDSINIHYVPLDKKAKGNLDHMKMDLIKNEDTGIFEETKWELLPYDRKYTIIVSAKSN